MELMEVSDDTIHFKLPQCVLGIQGTSRELCEAMMNADEHMLNNLLRREVDMEILKTVAAGDNECEVKFSIKS